MSKRRISVLYWFLPFAFWHVTYCAFSQNVFSSEEELKKQANKYFDDEDFTKAYPLFSQLLSLYPKDPQYNYKFGTCLLFSSNDKGKTIAYIEFAAKRQKQNIDKKVFFYLGKAYHLNYQFSDAIKSYTTFKTIASSKEVDKFEVDRQIEMCENGKQLLKNISELTVLEKKEVPVSDFFRSYNISEFNAKLIIKPDDLKSSIDKKKKDESVMYLAPDRSQIYYSSYGEDGKTGRDIFYVTRSAEGELSQPTRLPDVVNTKYDEDFAFLHPNGKTLYFSSKGHSSMGGYDIFKSEWNNNTQAWGKPVNMDFAINTPDDDILFISDAENKSAYFSSKRESADGNINVYKIKLERKPLELAVIKGVLIKKTGDNLAKATITVTKILNEEVVGVFNTNATDGSYTLGLPNGGKFMFSVESDGFKKASEVVVIPRQQEIKTMKQVIELVNENGKDKILIKNEFDAPVDSADIQLAIQFIKAKASLDVSAEEEKIITTEVDENSPESKEEKKATSKAEKEKNITPVTNADIIDIAYQDAKQTQKDANELRKNSDNAQQLSKQKNEVSIQKQKEAEELIKLAEVISNQEEKIAQINKAEKIKKESEVFRKESALSLTLSNQMNELAIAKQKQADAELIYAKDLESVIKSGGNEAKMNELLARKEDLDRNSEVLSAIFPPDMSKQINESQGEANKSMSKYLEIQQDVEGLQGESKHLRAEAEATKNEGVKQNLIQQAEEMEKEMDAKKQQAENYNLTAKQKQIEVDSLKENVLSTTSIMKQIYSASETPIANNQSSTLANNTKEDKKQDNGQDKNISATAPDPVVHNSNYTTILANQEQEAVKKTNELEKYESLALVYQTWTDTLDKQISYLKQQSELTTKAESRVELQNKIYELQSSADEKRQKAADARNKVDNLKLQAALASASTIPSDNTVNPDANTKSLANATEKDTQEKGSSDNTSSPDNLKGLEDINSYFSGKLKGNEKITNPYEKKLQDQMSYQSWSSSLYDESQRLKQEGDYEKSNNAESQSKAKQLLAVQAAGEAIRAKTEQQGLASSDNGVLKGTKRDSITQSVTTSDSEITTQQPVKNNSTTNPIDSKSAESNQAKEIINTNTSPSQTTGVKNTPADIVLPERLNNTSTPLDVPASVKNKENYSHYVALKNESDSSKESSKAQFKQAEVAQKLSNNQFEESLKISSQIAKTNDPNERQRLQGKSDALDRSALRNQAKADSIIVIARNNEAEANAKNTESDLFLQSLDKASYEEISLAINSKTQTTVLKTGAEPMDSKKEIPTQKTNSTTATPTSVEPSVERVSAQTTPTAEKEKKLNGNTIAKVEPGKIKNTTPSKSNAMPVSKDAKLEPVIPNNSSTAPAVWADKNERASFRDLFKLPGSEKTSPTQSSSELLAYYDALFDRLEFKGSNYSPSKPIPVDAPMPEGLVFKVQIGAFKNPIPQDLFGGIKPITAETTTRGFMRYTAGLFAKFNLANKAKNQVVDIGYRDAFVVAFFNGKRISINEALAKAKENGESVENLTISSAVPSTFVSIPSNSTPLSSSDNTSFSSNSGLQIAITTDVKSINGLFYTIQIGVFSKPVSSIQLYNLSPLNSERTDNGLIRYTTGRFDDMAKAINAKNNISQKGISDAFIIAYRDGKRIGISSAKSMIDSEGKEVLSKNKQENTFTPSDITTTEASGKTLTAASNSGVVFKVQVGAFREQVPIDIANKLLANSERGIKTFKDENGLLVYTIGEYPAYETANNLKTQLVSEGLKDAFVIAFRNGKKMTATAAIELIKNR
jgi:hypothetical protein